jgi:hypothetical protein
VSRALRGRARATQQTRRHAALTREAHVACTDRGSAASRPRPQADLHDQRIVADILILHSPSNSVSGARGRGYPARHSKSLASLTQLLCGDMVWQSQTRTILSTFEYKCVPTFFAVGVARARPPPGRAPPGSAGARRSVPPCLDRSAAIGGAGGRIRSPPAARAPDRRELTARRRTQHVPSYCSSSTRRRRRHAT